jgi:hypothetical protein
MPLKVAALNVYPVKGLKGIALQEARCTARGLEHDRRWMVVDGDGVFLSQRSHPRMATVWTDIDAHALTLSAPDVDPVEIALDAQGPTLRVRVWKSELDAVAVSAPADRWLSEYLGFACRLVHMPDSSERQSPEAYGGAGHLVGFADAFAYLVVGEASLTDLNARLAQRGHAPLPMNRFRPNIVVSGGAPYAEDDWGEVRVGAAALRGVKPCGRCQVTTTDQATGEVRGPEPLATLATYRESAQYGVMFGANCIALQEGRIRVGDAVSVVS